jgi:hypothetical protein
VSGSGPIFLLHNQGFDLIASAQFRILDRQKLRFEGESIKLDFAELSTGSDLACG